MSRSRRSSPVAGSCLLAVGIVVGGIAFLALLPVLLPAIIMVVVAMVIVTGMANMREM